jgi:hypothetical protein
MPPSILSSNLINIPVLDLILSSPQTALNQPYHLQLLHTKLAILTNRPSQPKRRGFAADLEILETRLEVARVALCLQFESEGSAGSRVRESGESVGFAGGNGPGNDAGKGQESGSLSRELVPRPTEPRTVSTTQTQAGPSTPNPRPVPNYTLAEGELGIVEKECKGLTKRLCREIRARTDRAREKEREKVPGPSRTSSGASTSTSTADEAPSSTTSNGEPRSPDVEGYPSTETTPTQAPVPAFEKSTTLDPPTTSLSLHSLTPDDLNMPTSDTDADAGPIPPTSPTPGKYQARLQRIKDLRIRGLRLMADVQGMQGRPERQARWEGLALKLQAGSGTGSSSSSGPGASAIGES